MPRNALFARLEIFVDLRDDEKALLAGLDRDVRKFKPRQSIIREGDRPEQVHLIISGWAVRYKTLPDGSRQIIGFLLPGDFCDLHVAVLRQMDHAIVALTACEVAFIPSAEIDKLTSHHNSLAKALWWGTLVDEAVLRNWVVNIGRRDAHERIAHLLCELHLRMKMIGLVSNGKCSFPLTQEELADATGLTSVHTNRTLQRLRSEGLIELQGRMLTVLDTQALAKVAGFDPGYLHIERRENVSA